MKRFSEILFVIVLFGLLGCQKDPGYPDTPQIAFKSFQTFGTDSAILTISFKDGDGDIGLKPSDTLPPYNEGSPNYYDLFLEYYEYTNGVKHHITLTPPFYYRVQYIPNDNKIKDLNGDISVSLNPFYYDPITTADTFCYSIMLEDRALHKSNIVFTPNMVKQH